MPRVSQKTQKEAQSQGLITAEVAGRLLMITAERVHQLRRAGWIERAGDGHHFRLVDVVQGYIRFRDDADRRASKSSADGRVRDAKARDIEVRTAERLRDLVPLADAIDAMATVCGRVRAEFGGLAARITRDLTLRRQIDRDVNDCLTRIADGCDEEANALKNGERSTPAIEESAA